MSQSIFKKTALSLAIASTALPFAAFAANHTGAQDAAGGYFAPILTMASAAGQALTPTLGYGKKVATTYGVGIANAGTMNLKAFYYDANDVFTEAVTVAADTTNDAATNLVGTNTLAAAGNASYAKVRFVLHTVAAADGSAAIANEYQKLTVLNSGTGNVETRQAITFVPLVTPSTTADSDATVAARLVTEAAPAYNLVTYAGPTILKAMSASTPAKVPVDATFNVGLVGPNDTTDSKAQIDLLKSSDGTISGDTIFINAIGAGSALVTGSRALNLDAGSGFGTVTNFANNVGKVKIVASSGTITDLAGNAPAIQTVNITAYAKPTYDVSTAKAIATALATADSTDNRKALFTSAGLAASTNKDVTVTLRFAEGLTGVGTEDFVVAPADLSVNAAVASGNTVTLTLREAAADAKAWTVDSTGKLFFNGSAVTVQAIFAASPLTTVAPGGVAMASSADNLTATQVYTGMAETVTLKTRDDNVNGLIDGATYDFKEPIGTPANSDFTLKTNYGGTAKDISFVASLVGTSQAKLVMSNPVTADWTENGTAGEAADAAKYVATDFNTGIFGGALKYTPAIATTPALSYTTVYDATTGELSKIKSGVQFGAFPTTTADGAAPVVLTTTFNPVQGTSPASGNLLVTASEVLNLVGGAPNADWNFFSAGGSPITLLNLNDGLGAITGGALSQSVGGTFVDTVTFNTVTASVANKLLTIGSAPAVGDTTLTATANLLATDGTKTITTGTTAFTGPKIQQAIATRDAADTVAGNFTKVLVKFDKPITLATVGKTNQGVTITATGVIQDGMFKVRSRVASVNYDVPITAANVDLSAASTGYVTLTLPAPGVVGSATNMIVEYTDGTGNNKLVSTDAVMAQIFPLTASFNDTAGGANGVVDSVTPDNAQIQLSQNSTKLYTQELSGTFTLDGTAVTANGTIVRADLVGTDQTSKVSSAALTVPCGCAAGTATVSSGTVSAAVATSIDNARKLGQATANAFVQVTHQANTAADVAAVLSDVAGGQASFPVTIDVKTGEIKGTSATGQAVLGTTNLLKVFDTDYQVTNNGVFRLSVGITPANNAPLPAGLFIMVSVKQPADKNFTLVTSPVEQFANFLPFSSDVTNNAGKNLTIPGKLGTVDLSRIVKVAADNTLGWQLLGIKGAVNLASSANSATTPIRMERAFLTIDGAGNPATAWSGDNVVGDQAFSLVGNTVASSLEVTATGLIDGLVAPKGGFGWAFSNDAAAYRTLTGTAPGFVDATAISASNPNNLFNLFIPVTNINSPAQSVAKGWSLITPNSDIPLASLSTANAASITAAISVGSGIQSKSWFSGESANTLTTLKAGMPYFVFFSTAMTITGTGTSATGGFTFAN